LEYDENTSTSTKLISAKKSEPKKKKKGSKEENEEKIENSSKLSKSNKKRKSDKHKTKEDEEEPESTKKTKNKKKSSHTKTEEYQLDNAEESIGEQHATTPTKRKSPKLPNTPSKRQKTDHNQYVKPENTTATTNTTSTDSDSFVDAKSDADNSESSSEYFEVGDEKIPLKSVSPRIVKQEKKNTKNGEKNQYNKKNQKKGEDGEKNDKKRENGRKNQKNFQLLYSLSSEDSKSLFSESDVEEENSPKQPPSNSNSIYQTSPDRKKTSQPIRRTSMQQQSPEESLEGNVPDNTEFEAELDQFPKKKGKPKKREESISNTTSKKRKETVVGKNLKKKYLQKNGFL